MAAKLTYEETPRFHESKFKCPSCRAFTGQEWSPLFVVRAGYQGPMIALLDPETEENYFGEDLPDNAHWNAARCVGCSELTFWRGEDLAYPLAGMESLAEPHPALPNEAKGLLSEAIAVFPISRRAAAALCRAALESLLKEVIAPTLDKKLNLAGLINSQARRVTPELWKLLVAIRYVGNKTLHGADGSDESVRIYLDENEDYVPRMLIEAVNRLAVELIEAPRLTDEIYQSLPDEVRAGAEREIEKYGTEGDPIP